MITFYKPQKSGKGSLVNFTLAAGKGTNGDFREGCVYCKMIKQTTWDDSKHTGGFKGGDMTNVKLNLMELGKIIATLERGIPFSGYHSGYDQNVQINFAPWQDKETQEQRGYGLVFNVAKGGEKKKFAVGFQFGEDIVLKEFCKLAIEHIMLANYAEEKRKIKASRQSKDEQPAESSGEASNNQLEDDIGNIFN